jgi:hypothetical protein
MRVVRATMDALPELGRALHEIERRVSYPLGEDRFRIDHGRDYFAFFRRLGAPTVLEYQRDDGKVVGACTYVRRRLWIGGVSTDALYACDLKLSEDARGAGRKLLFDTVEMLGGTAAIEPGYAVTMDPSTRRNPVPRLIRSCLPDARASTTLSFFSWSHDEMRDVESVVQDHRGPLSYLSLQGQKDIVLESTGAPLPLLHVQHGPCAERELAAPVHGSLHMICTPTDDPLTHALRRRGCAPMASATVVAHRLELNWSFILSSDI